MTANLAKWQAEGKAVADRVALRARASEWKRHGRNWANLYLEHGNTDGYRTSWGEYDETFHKELSEWRKRQ